jgi:hypothetical protein
MYLMVPGRRITGGRHPPARHCRDLNDVLAGLAAEPDVLLSAVAQARGRIQRISG